MQKLFSIFSVAGRSYLFCLLMATTVGAAEFKSPFEIMLAVNEVTEAYLDVQITVTVPEHHVIYAETFQVTPEAGSSLERRLLPQADHKPDPLDASRQVEVYAHTFTSRWHVMPPHDGTKLRVTYQGCDDTVCFMPETHRFQFDAASASFVPDTGEAVVPDQSAVKEGWAEGFTMVSGGGYMKTDAFLAFLDQAEGTAVATAASGAGWGGFLRDPVAFFHVHGLMFTLVLVLIGGVLLNLTPCVLPMIPINLAVIGAGAGTRGRGFFLGTAYGAGMILVYGGLGWVILRSGLFFGALQSSPWFSLSVALIFVVLALAMFDVFVIDFTRFASQKGRSRHTGVLAAFFAGALSALLAGACVAPVVLAVLLLAGTLYASGATEAQFLPFILGLGMALPWPFAGMGLSILPNPGMWMVRIKYVFGAFLVLLSAYYFYLAGVGFIPSAQVAREGSITANDQAAWQEKIALARQLGRPVLVDFWATWCKNCTVMEQTTFKDDRVRKRLADYVVVKVQAEKPERSPAREMLHAFGIRGLPGFVVLTPASEGGTK